MVRTKRNTLLGLTLGGLLATGAMGGVLAQDAPPAGVVTHPAHVHMGSCAELDPNPKYPLTSVGPRLTEDNELPATEDVKGSLTASPVEYSRIWGSQSRDPGAWLIRSSSSKAAS